MKKERYPWMDYVKMLASIMIVTGHFHDAAFDFCANAPAAPGWYRILNALLVPLQNGKFWIMVFCIISGFLGAKKIRNFRELLAECITRYLRFFIPLLIVNIFSFLLYSFGLYASGEYGALMDNSWIGNHYLGPFGISDVFRQSITFGAALDSSLWMMRPLFLGNMLILFSEYSMKRLSEKRKCTYEIIVLILLMIAGLRFSSVWYCAAVYLGLVFHDCKRVLFLPEWSLVFAGLALCFYYLPWIGTLLGLQWDLLNQPRIDFFVGMVFSFGFFFSNYHGREVTKLPLSSMSFWIFLLHSPILCSLSCAMLLHSLTHFWLGFWLALSVLIAVTVLLSYALSVTVEKWSANALKQFKKRLIGAAALKMVG